MSARLRLGELLVNAQLITKEQLSAALAEQARTGDRLGAIIVRHGMLTDTQVTQILSQQLSVPWVSLHHVDFAAELLDLVPADVACAHRVVPVYVRRVKDLGEVLYVAMEDPSSDEGLREVSAVSGFRVRPLIASTSDVTKALARYYGLRTPVAASSDERTPAQPAAAANDALAKPRPPRKPAAVTIPRARPSFVLTTTDGREVALESIAVMQALASRGAQGIDPEHWHALCEALLQLLAERDVIAGWDFTQGV